MCLGLPVRGNYKPNCGFDMRIMLTMNLCYEPALGGANKANRIVAEMLVRKGHSVKAIVRPAGILLRASNDRPSEKCNGFGRSICDLGGCRTLHINGVEVYEVDGPIQLMRERLAQEIQDFRPDCVLVSSEDPMQSILQSALQHSKGRVIYLAHTPGCLPFGPYSFNRSHRRSQLFGEVRVIIATSHFCAQYIEMWSTLKAVQVYLPVYGNPPYPNFSQFRRGYITLINCCTYKGIDIFVDLARAFPVSRFAAVTSWGTTLDDRRRMADLSNIDIMEPMANIDMILSETSVLLVPSIALENFPMVVIEGMLRGIPVIASNVGGIPEAKLGTNYVLPVTLIEQFKQEWDEKGLWIPVVPQQDCAPWSHALSELTSSRAIYERESAAMRSVAEQFVAGLGLEPFEEVLEAVCTM
jgi:glycosyltransferase involved in cell wall biosynthesis